MFFIDILINSLSSVLISIARGIEGKRHTRNYCWEILVRGKDLIWRIRETCRFLLSKYDIDIDKDAEYCLISYMKCGQTWLRVMIKKAVQLHFGLNSKDMFDLMFEDIPAEDLKQASICLPKIFVTHDDVPHLKTPRELVRLKKKYANKKVIFLVRDPRDAIVSNYFHQSRRVIPVHVKWDSPEMDKRVKLYRGTLHQYLHGKIGGFETLLKFYNIWARNRHIPKSFLLVRYEDIHRDPKKELRRILNFLGLELAGDDVIDEAVRFASFENMRWMEEEGVHTVGSILRPGDRNDKESFKTRRGKVGGFTDYLDAADIKYLNGKMGEFLSDFYGYKRLER